MFAQRRKAKNCPLVKEGSVSVGDYIVAGEVSGKIKNLTDINLDLLEVNNYQCYSPILEKIFILNENNFNKIIFTSNFVINKILRIGIALIGIGLSFNQILQYSLNSIILILFNIILVFVILILIGKVFNLSKKFCWQICQNNF